MKEQKGKEIRGEIFFGFCFCQRAQNCGSGFAFFTDVRFQSATQRTASVHTSHMPKPVM